jgi:hypothetical protein
MSLVANILQQVEPTPPSRVRWSDFIVTIDGEEINCKNNMTKAWKLKHNDAKQLEPISKLPTAVDPV